MPCKRVTGAQALVANCFYVSIQAAFVLLNTDHCVCFERPPPMRNLTMTVRNCADLLQNTANWFRTLPVPRGSTWHREVADALHVLAAHKSSYVPVTNEVFPAVLAYRLKEFATLHPWYRFLPQLVDDLWGRNFSCVDHPHFVVSARHSVRPGLTSTQQFDDA